MLIAGNQTWDAIIQWCEGNLVLTLKPIDDTLGDDEQFLSGIREMINMVGTYGLYCDFLKLKNQIN